MTEEAQSNPSAWKEFVRRHWRFCIIVVAVMSTIVIDGLFVFLWRVGLAPTHLGTPQFIGDWTIGFLVSFLLDLLLWGFLLVGLPLFGAMIAAWGLWWNRLPSELKARYKKSMENDKPHQKAKNSTEGALSFISVMVWLILVFTQGYWDTAFSAWEFDAFINVLLLTLLWEAVVIGIPVVILGTIWLCHELKKP